MDYTPSHASVKHVIIGGRREPVQMPDKFPIPRYFLCPICYRKSFNENDIRERYCSACHRFFQV